ncbi:hypothetical protein HJG60_008083 [Phyllostomus discolor]|uniref:Uncharacterized protein n=1 Tax=Phyllostomus discolor TaxID=89673 RepID=A0A834BK65_9CHIR|nr:hypothetical protein HJG60_008083 [Phyllostomus discolor]
MAGPDGDSAVHGSPGCLPHLKSTSHVQEPQPPILTAGPCGHPCCCWFNRPAHPQVSPSCPPPLWPVVPPRLLTSGLRSSAWRLSRVPSAPSPVSFFHLPQVLAKASEPPEWPHKPTPFVARERAHSLVCPSVSPPVKRGLG